MSSAEKHPATPPTAEAAIELNPMQGGRWRRVRPEELLRTIVPSPGALDHSPEAETEQEPEPETEQEAETETEQEAKQEREAKQEQEAEQAAGAVRETPKKKRSKPKLRLERRQELEHHLKESPTDLDAFLELGRIYRHEHRPLDARRILQQAIEIFPEEKELIWEYEEAVLARSLQQLREVTELAHKLNTAETDRELKRSQNDWACRRMDVCLARLSRDPSRVHLRVALGEAMYDAGMYEGAIEEVEFVLENDDLSPLAYLIRGRCLLAMGKDVEAMASLRAAALRRSVVAPPRTRVIALRLLCETAERLGVGLTLAQYRKHLQQAEQDLAKQASH